MSITAKELAKQLNLSEAAISMALNNKPGVSTRTRKRVIAAATAAGYDFSRLSSTDAARRAEQCVFSIGNCRGSKKRGERKSKGNAGTGGNLG